MKNTLIIILFCGLISILCTIGLVACSSVGQLGNAELVENYKSIDDLIVDSPIVVMGTVDSKNNEFVYGEVTFALTKFKVEKIIRGEVSDTINILQTKINQDPLLKMGDEMVLFLIRYEGPVTEDAYRIKGLYQGQYKIEGTRVIKNNENKLTDDKALENIETLITRVNSIEYVPQKLYKTASGD